MPSSPPRFISPALVSAATGAHNSGVKDSPYEFLEYLAYPDSRLCRGLDEEGTLASGKRRPLGGRNLTGVFLYEVNN